jgi:drug/metabolite transporter (DMT)-like permease
MMTSISLRGIGLLLLAATAWGGLFPVAMVTLPVLDPFYMTAIRYGITAAIFVALLVYAEGPKALDAEGRAPRLAFLGSAGFAGLGLFVFVGLEHSRPEHGAVIMATQPLIAAVAGWALRGVRPARATLALLGVALIGVLLVVTKGRFAGLFTDGTGFGDALMFVGALSWVIYTMGVPEFPSWSPLRYTTLTVAFGLPAIFGAAAIATATGYVSTPSVRDVESVGWQLAYIVGVASVLGVLSWNAGNKLVGVINGVLFINFVPVTVFAIRIAQGHRFQPIEFVGAALVIGALIANNVVARRAGKSTKTEPTPQVNRCRNIHDAAGSATAASKSCGQRSWTIAAKPAPSR